MNDTGEKNQNKLSRRRLLQGIAGLLVTHSMPVSTLLPTLEATTVGWPLDLLKTLPIIKALADGSGILEASNTVEDVNNGALKCTFLSDEEVLREDFSGRLRLAWEGNLVVSGGRLDSCEELEQAIKAGIDMTPETFFSLVRHKENRDKIAHIFFEQSHPISPTFDQAWFEQIIDLVSELFTRYPALKSAGSFEALIKSLRDDIAEALKLPLEDGCLDLLAEAQNGPDLLTDLLTRAPELFPEGKLSTFQRLADDLKVHGHQTICLEDISKPRDDWHLHAQNLTYRFGLTPLQNDWSNQEGESKPKVGERKESFDEAARMANRLLREDQGTKTTRNVIIGGLPPIQLHR